MGKRKRRRRRKTTIHVTPLGYAVLAVLIVIAGVGIYFIAWSLGKERTAVADSENVPPVVEFANTFAVADPAAPTPTLVSQPFTAPSPERTPIPTVSPVPTPSPGMANDVRMPTEEQIASALDGVLNNSGVVLRKGPDSGYEVVDKYTSGTKLKIYGESGDYYFCQVIAAGKYGYMAKKFVQRFGLMPGESPTPSPEGKSGTVDGIVSAKKLSLRSVPTTEGNDPIGECNLDTRVWIYFETGDFYYIEVVGSGEKGYMAKKHVTAQSVVPMGTPIP